MCQRSLVPKALECWAHTRPLEEALKAPPPFGSDQTEKDEPQPHVVVAFGFLITNCEP